MQPITIDINRYESAKWVRWPVASLATSPRPDSLTPGTRGKPLP